MPHSPNRLDPAFWQALDPKKIVREYPVGACLFEKGTPSRGIYLIEQGGVSVSLNRPGSSAVAVVGPGAILGLTESIASLDYQSTVEAVEPTRAAFVKRSDLLSFLHQHCEICMQVVQLLSEDLHVLYNEARSMELPPARHRRKSQPKPQ